ncbi:ASCH domain-containing protein [Celerinatantimonas sp. YJH-8]|uniref:ASCH domain-containing protein n=1 Tax=Celerinatantimonas sp. YJH-8 TaxID=3228714 RepID=UPI0038C999A6
MNERCQAYLDHYLNSLPSEIAAQYTSFSSDYFCADEYNANVCAELIRRGEKRASCSLDDGYHYKGEERPKVGHLLVVTNWSGEPVCIVAIKSVSKCKFKEVTAEFAAAEGEGDKTLTWWRKVHWEFFSNECAELGITPHEDMVLVLERFQVVYA